MEIQVVQTSGDKLVCVQRTDLDLYKDNRARTLATSDNRVAELDLDWDVEQILQDIDQVSIEGLPMNACLAA